MSNPPVPSLSPLSGVKDPATRAALQAINDQLRVRNGEVGNGDARFLTKGDLADELVTAVGGGSGKRKRSSLSVGGGLNGAIQAIIDKMTEQITSSAIWKELSERLQWIDTPEWFVGKFGAAIKQEQIIRETEIKAQATQLSTAVANIDNNISLVQQELTATSDQTSANASAITQVQVGVADVRAIAQEGLRIATNVNGEVKGSWTVKFDVNGYVAGVGLGLEGKGGSYSSSFVVKADRFAIAGPSGSTYIPFIVNTTDPNLPAVTINGNMVVNGTITAKKISGIVSIASGSTSCAIVIPAGQKASIIATGSVNFFSSGGEPYDIYMSINGQGYVAASANGGYAAGLSTGASFGPISGPTTFSIGLSYGFPSHAGTGSWGSMHVSAIAVFESA